MTANNEEDLKAIMEELERKEEEKMSISDLEEAIADLERGPAKSIKQRSKVWYDNSKPKARDTRLEGFTDESEQEYNPELGGLPKQKFERMQEFLNTIKSDDEEVTDEQLEEFCKIMTEYQKFKRHGDYRPKGDLDKDGMQYDKVLHEDLDNAMAITEFDEEGDAGITYDDYYRYNEYHDRHCAKYPPGYRQYENYENYKIENPGASIQEYHETSKSTLK